jgi:GT2 family glycosyltransferase
VEFELTCVVVDNSATEQSRGELRGILEQHNWTVYLSAGRNIGYFGGLNFGLNSLNLDEWSAVVICNNDLEFESDFCRKLAISQYPDSVFSVCPDVVTRDGLHQNPHVLERISSFRRLQFDLYFSHYWVARLLAGILRLIRPKKASPPQPEGCCEIHMGIGACYVLTRGFLSRFKSLSYPHFLYGEEAFFSDQIHSAGGVLWFDPALVVHHAESAATSKVPRRITYEFARESYSDYRDML